MNKKTKRGRRNSSVTLALACIAGLLLLLLVLMLLVLPRMNPSQTDPIDFDVTMSDYEATISTAEETTEPTEEPTVPETEPQILAHLAEMAAKNPDMIGWISIKGTKLDYPLMYCAEDNEKYLHKDIDLNFSIGGLPFVDSKCGIDPSSDNWVIYGHNMKNGTMFRALMNYADQSYWEEHPVILLSSLYEEKEYEILAAFYDRIYYKHETVFKFYQFITAEDEADYNYAVSQFKEKSLYDTGVTAEYGDHLITLVTCSYHVDNGRFVVVAREVTDENRNDS